jgi:transposase-like protein
MDKEHRTLSSFLQFSTTYKDEATCIKALADLRWRDGFTCDRCGHRKAYQLHARPRIFECAACGHQYSVTAGCIFHKTRTPLLKWFMAMYLIARDKRGVSGLFISKELDIRYETAWLMCHKIRHALSERDEFRLQDFI